jgi:hypothetical protein
MRQPPFLVPQALLAAISFNLLRVVLAIFLPIVRVRLAPLPRTVQADLLIHRIGSDLLPMIIGTALALACRLAANPLLRMIRVRLKSLLTVTATAILHQAAPKENGMGSFSPEASLDLNTSAKKFSAYRDYRFTPSPPMGLLLSLAAIDRQHDVLVRSVCLLPRNASRLRGVMSSRKSADLSARNRDRWLWVRAAPRNNTLCITVITLSKAL